MPHIATIETHRLEEGTPLTKEILSFVEGNKEEMFLDNINEVLGKEPGGSCTMLITARVGEELIGCLLTTFSNSDAQGVEWAIRGVLIKPNKRHQGIGRQLIDTLKFESKQYNAHFLSALITANNPIYKQFLEHQRFDVTELNDTYGLGIYKK